MPEGGISLELQGKIKPIKSFKTAQGSVYTYDSEGKTTRFKTATGEKMERQDITVFVDLTPDEEQEVLRGYLHKEDDNIKVYVLEVEQSDKPPRIIRDINQVKDSGKIALGVLKNGSWSLFKKASVTPIVGWSVFDHKHYQKNGDWFSDRHLGNKVTEINYEPTPIS